MTRTKRPLDGLIPTKKEDDSYTDETLYIHCRACGKYLMTLKQFKENKVDGHIQHIYCKKCAKINLVNCGTRRNPEYFTHEEIAKIKSTLIDLRLTRKDAENLGIFINTSLYHGPLRKSAQRILNKLKRQGIK